MILRDIKRYLQEHQQATLSDLANHFDTPPEVMQGMVAAWIQKGHVTQSIVSETCGSSCSSCGACTCGPHMILYRWRA